MSYYNTCVLTITPERVVARYFNAHISNAHLLPVQQSSYHPFHSTETAILSVNNDLVRAIDNGQVTLLVLLDRSAAFDTRDHSVLLSILSSLFSVIDTAFSWFQSSFTYRTQYIVFAGQRTLRIPVHCSSPQSSVLGPLGAANTEDITQLLMRPWT